MMYAKGKNKLLLLLLLLFKVFKCFTFQIGQGKCLDKTYSLNDFNTIVCAVTRNAEYFY